LPTRGLVSIAGIAPLDWLLDNTGPIARDVTDAAIALSVMAGEDPLDARTAGSTAKAQPGPYTRYLKADALKGKRFGVPAFIMNGAGIPFQGIAASVPQSMADSQEGAARLALRPETRETFMKAIDGLRAAGATVILMTPFCPTALPRR
jgi:Asp-tRNA(Asn)/Glu-tRNA(Gln) amidotransferase A subunit family amidase